MAGECEILLTEIKGYVNRSRDIDDYDHLNINGQRLISLRSYDALIAIKNNTANLGGGGDGDTMDFTTLVNEQKHTNRILNQLALKLIGEEIQ